MPSGLRRKLTCLLFGLSGLALGVIGAERHGPAVDGHRGRADVDVPRDMAVP